MPARVPAAAAHCDAGAKSSETSATRDASWVPRGSTVTDAWPLNAVPLTSGRDRGRRQPSSALRASDN